MSLFKWVGNPQSRERVWLLAKTEFKLRYYQNKLGILWAIINPLVQISIYYLVFEVMMNGGVENFALYVFAGFFLWMFFTDSTNRMTRVLKSKRQYYENTEMNKMEVYIAVFLGAVIGFLFNCLLFLIVAGIYQVWPSPTYLYFPIIVLILFVICFGIGLILSSIFLYVSDISEFWPVLLRFGFFLSPILFRGDRFIEKLPILLYLNPLSGLIINTRRVLLFNQSPDWGLMGFNVIFAVIVLLIGLWCYRRFSPHASELI